MSESAKRSEFEAQALPLLPHLLRTALYVSGVEIDAKYLVTVTIARAYRSWHKYQVISDFRVWLFKTLTTVLVHKYGSVLGLSSPSARVAALDLLSTYAQLGWQAPVRDPRQLPVSAISVEDVEKAIRELPHHLKLIVVLSLVEGFSYPETAEIAGIAVATVRARVHQGRTMMRRALVDRVTGDGIFDMAAGGIRRRRMG
jgi:RNA polymerase sigma-70 factor (ECF subfamily)